MTLLRMFWTIVGGLALILLFSPRVAHSIKPGGGVFVPVGVPPAPAIGSRGGDPGPALLAAGDVLSRPPGHSVSLLPLHGIVDVEEARSPNSVALPSGKAEMLSISPSGPFSGGASPSGEGAVGRSRGATSRSRGPVGRGEYPFVLLASLAGQEEWLRDLALRDENPFSQRLVDSQKETQSGKAEVKEGEDQPGDDGGDESEEPGQEDAPVEGEQTETKPLDSGVFCADATEPSGLREYQLVLPMTPRGVPVTECGEDQYTTKAGRRVGMVFSYFPTKYFGEHFYLVKDLSGDGSSDVLCLVKPEGIVQPVLARFGAPLAWDFPTATQFPAGLLGATPCAYSPSHPYGMAFYSWSAQQLILADPKSDYSFSAFLTLPAPPGYDGLVSDDFDVNGVEDLALVSFSNNRIVYMLNREAGGFAVSPSPFSYTAIYSSVFYPYDKRDTPAVLWTVQYHAKTLVYISGERVGSPVLLGLFEPLSPGECLVVGDFNMDGELEFGIGRTSG